MENKQYIIKSIKLMSKKEIPFEKIKEKFFEIKPNILNVCIENKDKLLEFIYSKINTKNKNESIKNYINNDNIDTIYKFINEYNNWNIDYFNNIFFNENKLRFYLLIDFLKNYLSHDIIKIYKSNIVDYLIYSACKLVVKIAKEIKIPVNLEDKIQAGFIGLTESAWHYDFRTSTKFISYAKDRIRLYIYRLIKTNLNISIPYNKLEKYSKLISDYLEYISKNYLINNEENENILNDEIKIEEFINKIYNKHKNIDINEFKSILNSLNVEYLSSLIENNKYNKQFKNRSSDDYLSNDIYNSYNNDYKEFEENDFIENIKKFAKKILSPLEYNIFLDYFILNYDNNINYDYLINKYKLGYYKKLHIILEKIKNKLKFYFKNEYELCNFITSDINNSVVNML